jgi:hypothetical protein
MIITDRFVYIHYPKTGGTFVSTVLDRLYKSEATTPAAGFVDTGIAKTPGVGGKHGTCQEIPPEHSHKPVLTTVRSPYDRYVSQFAFGFWKKKNITPAQEEQIRNAYSSFPDLSFAEFVEMANRFFTMYANSHFSAEDMPGWHTQQLYQFCARSPKESFAGIDAAYIEAGAWTQDLFPVHFLHTDNLNRELHDFLLQNGHKPEDLEFILQSGKIFPPEGGRSENEKWQKYYTPELKAFVRHKERILFKIFPEFDV